MSALEAGVLSRRRGREWLTDRRNEAIAEATRAIAPHESDRRNSGRQAREGMVIRGG